MVPLKNPMFYTNFRLEKEIYIFNGITETLINPKPDPNENLLGCIPQEGNDSQCDGDNFMTFIALESLIIELQPSNYHF